MKPVEMTKTDERDPIKMALTNDVVMDNVLKHLKIRDVLSCRQVSKIWNKAASSVLRRRSTMIKSIYNEDHLMQLEQCIQQSSDFPLAGISFNDPWKFSCDGAREFFQNYGYKFTRLRFNATYTRRLQDLAPFINHLPRLSILELYPPEYSHSGFECPDFAVAPGRGKILKLPSVRTVRLLFPSCKAVNEEILREVLTAASSSVQIEILDVNPVILQALQSAGKFRAVSVMKFYCMTPQMYKFLSTVSPSLTKLALRGCWLDGLEKILFSSQYTLKELELKGPCVRVFMCSSEKFPVLTKLSRLSLHVWDLAWDKHLFHGTHGNKFPGLKELLLNLNECLRYSLSDDLFIVPSVSTIHIIGHIYKDGIKSLARSFPSVTDLRLDHGFYSQSSWDEALPFEVWSVREFKHLEKLRIWNVGITQPCIAAHAMDRFLTGIPVEICKTLLKQKQLNLNDPVQQVPRDNPCILQLENLKDLIVCVKPGRRCGFGELPQDTMTMVSVWYALEMMPNLRAKFVYEQAEDKADLEAVFKIVQPSVNLERFFD